MDRETVSESKEVTVYESKPLIESEVETKREEERIRVFEPEKKQDRRELFMQIWRWLAITAAFVAIFTCMYLYLDDQLFGLDDEFTKDHLQNDSEDIPTVAEPAGSESKTSDIESAGKPKAPPVVIDESMSGIDIAPELNTEYSLSPLFGSSDGIKVIIIHSHNSEYVSESISVSDAGEALAQIFNSAGIETLHSKHIHDADSSIGSYKRMNDTLNKIIIDNPGVLCVIDLHDSDSGLPLTFTLGTDSEYGTKENLKLAAAIYGEIEETECAFRFLPEDLGQNTGLLSINVGICGKGIDDETARKAVAAFAEAFMNICNKNAADGE